MTVVKHHTVVVKIDHGVRPYIIFQLGCLIFNMETAKENLKTYIVLNENYFHIPDPVQYNLLFLTHHAHWSARKKINEIKLHLKKIVYNHDKYL